MVDKIAEYRERATYCRKMADDTRREDLKVGWLDLAARWLEMAGLRTPDGGKFSEPVPKAKLTLVPLARTPPEPVTARPDAPPHRLP